MKLFWKLHPKTRFSKIKFADIMHLWAKTTMDRLHVTLGPKKMNQMDV